MKIKKALFFIIFHTFFSGITAQDFNFSVTPKIGFQYGQLGEYLTSSSKEYYISYLQWDFKSLPFIGLEGNGSYKDLNVNTGFNYLLPFYCGNLYDSDYTPTFKSNFATLPNRNVLSIDFDFNFYYDFKLPASFTISPFAGFEYSYYSFSSDEGSGYFGVKEATKLDQDVPWNDERALYVQQTNGIDYYRESYYVFAGIKLGWSYENLSLDFTSLVSPYTFTKTMDYHRDEINGGKGRDYHLFAVHQSYFTRFREDFSLSYKVNPALSLVVNFSSLFGGIDKGPLYSDKYKNYGIFNQGNGDWTLLSQLSGVDVYSFTFDVGAKLNF